MTKTGDGWRVVISALEIWNRVVEGLHEARREGFDVSNILEAEAMLNLILHKRSSTLVPLVAVLAVHSGVVTAGIFAALKNELD